MRHFVIEVGCNRRSSLIKGFDSAIEALPKLANLTIDAVSRSTKGRNIQFLKSLRRLAKLLPKAASLFRDGGSNDVRFRPENLRCALRGEHTWQLLRPEKTKGRKQRRNTGSRGRNHEQDEFCRHGGSSHMHSIIVNESRTFVNVGLRDDVFMVDKSSPAQTDKETRLSLSVQNCTELMRDEHCADSLRELYFI